MNQSFWKGSATFKFDHQMMQNWNSCFELKKAQQIMQWRCELVLWRFDINSHQFQKSYFLYKIKIQRRCWEEFFYHPVWSYRDLIFNIVK